MQIIKDFIIDLFKISTILVGLTLIMMLFGFLTGAESTHSRTIDYFNNIDYEEQIQIESLRK